MQTVLLCSIDKKIKILILFFLSFTSTGRKSCICADSFLHYNPMTEESQKITLDFNGNRSIKKYNLNYKTTMRKILRVVI